MSRSAKICCSPCSEKSFSIGHLVSPVKATWLTFDAAFSVTQTWFYLLSSHAFYFSFVREDDACWKQRWLRDADVFGLRRTALAEETSQGEGVPHRVQPQGTLDVRHGLNRPPCQGRAKLFHKSTI